MRAAVVLSLALLWPGAALAQQDDRDYLTAFLEDNLSGVGRQVTITGFAGALSSRATMQRLQIADDSGVWITLDDVVLDWSRSSLLSGEVVVNELSAATITLARLPTAPDNALPAPEAPGFALPDLPVSVDIDALRADRIVLDPAVLGEPVEGRFQAALSLAGGEGSANLVLERTDGPESRIALDAAYSNASTVLRLDLTAAESAGGIAARMLGLPGEPSIDLAIRGEGPLTDFAAEVRLASDGTDRLSGPVTLTQQDDGALRFAADLAGNLAPLFLPDYAAFLGDEVGLKVDGRRWPSGRVALDRLAMQARALALDGTLSLAADGLPQAFALTGRIGTPDSAPVLLPLPGEVRVTGADITLSFDAAKDNGWSGRAQLTGLETGDLRLDRATLAGSGRIDRISGRSGLGATLTFDTEGLALADAALQRALGRDLTGQAVLTWREGEDALRLPRLSLQGADYGATASLRVEGLAAGLNTTGRITLTAADLSRFSDLTGLALAGAADVTVEGEASRLTGGFDLALTAAATGLRTGIDRLDPLLAGASRLTLSARRDETGTRLRSLDLTAGPLALTAAGQVATSGSDLAGTVRLTDLGALDPAWGGALTADARFTGTPDDGQIALTGQARDLRLGQPEVDRLIGGSTAVEAAAALRDGGVYLTAARIAGANLTAEARGNGTGNALQVSGRLRDLALLAPGFPGPVALSGRIEPRAGGADLDLRVQGPAAIDLRVAGSAAAGRADLTLAGTGNAVLLNPLADPAALAGALRLDLALRGPYALSSLSGRATLSNGRLAYPGRGLALTRLEAVADLAQGRARLSATAEAVSGGRLRLGGSVGLTAPHAADLDLTLDGLRLRDPELFETTASGALRITGPILGRALLAGRIDLGETTLLVPSTGFASASDLEALRHVGDSAAVRATRARAGIGAAARTAGGAGAGGPDWALNLLIDAPNRIFLRGRGLDAELGGAVTLGGTLRAVSPSGSISLIRGRLDLLGKRLVLSQASLSLEGDLVPYLTVSASNETDGVVSTITIEGPATAPEVSFSSVPELPEEEVLAWLLFGRGLQSISVLQAAELANAVAVLAGRGGEGIVSRLRKGFGLDDLDITTAEDGTASFSAGKYLTEKVYTEVEVDQDGKSRINLNLDVGRGVTVKGKVGTDGQSGIGVFIERDY